MVSDKRGGNKMRSLNGATRGIIVNITGINYPLAVQQEPG